MNIVLVEDHDAFREVLITVLEEAGHVVAGLSCAEEMAEAKVALPSQLYIVDVGLPGEDGLSLINRLRVLSPGAGILALSARSKTEARIAGYRSGADLYLCKPLDLHEFLAAVDAFGRRVEPGNDSDRRAIRIRAPSLRVRGFRGATTLTERELALVVAFGHARCSQLERWQVAEILGIDLELTSRTSLDVAITRLRSKLRQASGMHEPIRARRGLGYELRTEVVVE